MVGEFVVGVDGSEESRLALRWAAAAAGASGARLRVVQAWSHSASAVLPGGSVPAAPEEADRRVQEDVAAFVADALGGAPSPVVEAEAQRGPAAAALRQAVAPESVLILGSRGRGGFAGLLLGSVSQECIERAPCPVVVVRRDRLLAAGDTILVGKDGSPGAARALEWAGELAGVTGATVTAVHAWEASASEVRSRRRERLGAKAAATVEGWTQEAADDADAVEADDVGTVEAEGNPKDEIPKAAERLDAALTVVGRQGEGRRRGLLVGSVASHLVRHGPTNIAVVPAPSDSDVASS